MFFSGMASLRIVVLDGYTMNPGDLSWKELEALGDVTIYDRTPPELVVERCEGAQMALTNKTVLNAEQIKALPDLQYIGVLATGINVVDLEAARAQGVAVTNVPAYSTDSVVQMVFAHLLHYAQRVAAHDAAVKAGGWSASSDFTFTLAPLLELAGRRLGVVGLGSIGRGVAKVAGAFGMEVVAQTRTQPESLPEGVQALVGLDELLRSSDVVVLCCPLTSETQHLINAQSLSHMKTDAVLINTGRGPLVDEDALAAALKQGEIAWAGLDVLGQEPPAVDNPLIGIPNCSITPHIAWATKEARARLYAQVIRNIEAFRAGERLNRVD